MESANLIQTVLIYALPVLFAITVHEAAHGYAARHFGDNTAAMLGRITLNPIKHIDPVGTILMPLLLYFATSGAFLFGYAKPVPVRFDLLRHPKRDMVWVALAGPGANLLQALLWGIFMYLLVAAGVQERFFLEMGRAGVLVNVVMFAFNLFPLPPLDGGRVLVGVLPRKQAAMLARVEPWGFFIILGLVIANELSKAFPFFPNILGFVVQYWMQPVMGLTYGLLDILLTPLSLLLH
ncbi:site-2 protease family protein [Curvibacter sp. PAE-UM]|uniref:site-2 protease family protein n=1 Tax=Curvibacter sp. PAE-UM TaxID=1714344 RepID=UPI0007102E5D|nr:site-2 protease family protein [Curvibacter sp. PAE-UM]KRH99717.1 peptidase M50 [Curvibacter sp. PAE-UM]